MKQKKIIELSFDEYISLLSHKGISTNLTVKWKNQVINYISQQKKVAELLGLYREYREIVKQGATPYHQGLKINVLEKELGEMK